MLYESKKDSNYHLRKDKRFCRVSRQNFVTYSEPKPLLRVGGYIYGTVAKGHIEACRNTAPLGGAVFGVKNANKLKRKAGGRSDGD